jgi:hypothetical protein
MTLNANALATVQRAPARNPIRRTRAMIVDAGRRRQGAAYSPPTRPW